MSAEGERSDGFPPFNPNVEQGNVFVRWERWIRGLELMLLTKNIIGNERKKATLLHYGGFELQDVFYSIPNCDNPPAGENLYAYTKRLLTEYFKPRVNKTYERHVFRALVQKEDETMVHFIARLRSQAKRCEFTEEDDEIRDQIVERCTSAELRKRLLEKGDITLTEVIDTAMALETTAVHIKEMAGEQIAKVSVKKETSRPSQHKGGKRGYNKAKSQCFRCGYEGHLSSDEKCPARGKTCNKCQGKDHFSKVCKTKPKEASKQMKQINHTKADDNDAEPELDGYQFSIDEEGQQSQVNWVYDDERVVKCDIGGVCVDFMIDSGASYSIIDKEMWEFCKRKKIVCESRKYRGKPVYAYGQKEPLSVIGEFECVVTVGTEETKDVIVVTEKGRPLLAYKTAKRLNLIKVGLEVQKNFVNYVGIDENIFKGVGKLKDFELSLPIDPKCVPVAQPVRRTPYQLRPKLKARLDKLLRDDIIEKVEGPTPWVSPVVIAEKGNDEIRLCVDMRRADEAIIRERYPLPVFEEILANIGNNKSCIFSTLDIKSAYHQIVLTEESRVITTFVTEFGLHRYKRLMFGISCAPEMFQRIFKAILADIEGVEVFIDDVLVHGKIVKEHDDRVKRVCTRLAEKGLTLNREKCRFAQSEVLYMGFLISGKGYRPAESKIAAVENFRVPESPEEVRSFLGLVNYCGSFIPDLSTVSEPLRKLTRKDVDFVWTGEQDVSFEKLKHNLVSSETLGLYNLNAKTRIIADASPVGLGCVLTQYSEKGWRPICYASKSLTKCERNYAHVEKEALALIFACERFHNYIYGLEFDMVTDHKALEYLFTPKSKPNARLERWILRLQNYKYKVIYQPGKTNIADSLSRLSRFEQDSVKSQNDDVCYINWVAQMGVPKAMSLDEIDKESAKDPLLSQVREALKSGNWDKLTSSKFRMIKDELCVNNHVVLRGTRIVMPKSLQNGTLSIAHEAHPGIVAMKNRLRSKVWWCGIDKDAEMFVRHCESCQRVQKTVLTAPLKRNVLPEEPWEILAMDLLGPLPTGESILALVDYYSRYLEVIVLKSTTTGAIIPKLAEVFARHGLPRVIVSDNGTNLVSAEMLKWAKTNGIEIRPVTPAWPQANGEIERQNRSILKRLKIAHIEKRNWHAELTTYLLNYRATPHATTGVSPAEMLFNRRLRTKLPEMKGRILLDEEVREKDAWNKLRGKDYYDKVKRAKETEIKVGDTVLLEQPKTGKLSAEYGPEKFKVCDKNGDAITIEAPSGKTYKRNVKFVKPVPTEGVDCKLSSEISGSCNSRSPEVVPENIPAEEKIVRPKRNTKLPERFKDFDVTPK